MDRYHDLTIIWTYMIRTGRSGTEPERTTFDLSDRRGNASEETPAAYYVPDTLIDQRTGTGEITVKLSLKTKDQEEWFDKLKTIKALDQGKQDS